MSDNGQRPWTVVTGASRGLGAALVSESLAAGSNVFAVARSTNSELPATAEKTGNTLVWHRADLAEDPEKTAVEIVVAVAAAIRADGTPATAVTLFNNAATLDPVGLVGTGGPGRTSFALAVTLNVTAPLELTDRFISTFAVPEAVQNNLVAPDARLTVAQITSGAAQRVMPGLAVYSATKAALNVFTAVAAADIEIQTRRSSITPVTVVAISPGLVDSTMQEQLRDSDKSQLPGRSDYQKWQKEGRLRSPTVTARAILSRLQEADFTPGEFVHIGS